MSEFQTLIEGEFAVERMEGKVVQAEVLAMQPNFVVAQAPGTKSDSLIAVDEFAPALLESLSVGDSIEVMVESMENGWGETRLSHEKAVRARKWIELEEHFEAKKPVEGRVTERVKGGFTVAMGNIRAFLPGSLVDVRPVRDTAHLEGQDLEFMIIKMDKRRNNVVVSRRAVLEGDNAEEIEARLSELQEGQELTGVVKNITDYGAFVDLGGIDGLLHITDMSWKRVKHPSDLMNVGDEMKVKILRFDREKKRVSLGIKQLGADPWVNIEDRYPVRSRLKGAVTNVTDYGCFVEVEDGVEGLVHMSEMDWTNKNVHPSKVVSVGDEVEVMVLDIDGKRRRISLGIKQCQDNPWDTYASQHGKGERVKGVVRSITDFGLFVGLCGDIDGLVHMSDISWSQSGEEAVRQYSKGDEVEAVILAIDSDRERISLGIKQLDANPLDDYVAEHKNTFIKATVSKALAKSLTFSLADDVDGTLRIADYKDDSVADLRDVVKVGDTLDVRVVDSDRKYGVILSCLTEEEDKKAEARVEAARKAANVEPSKTTLGDLLKEKMNKPDEDA